MILNKVINAKFVEYSSNFSSDKFGKNIIGYSSHNYYILKNRSNLIRCLLICYLLVTTYEYIELLQIQVSPRSTIAISRMIDPKKEKEFFLNYEYLKKLESKEENKKESKKRNDIKKNEEKYYLNAIIEGYNHQSFRTKGFSIFRHQIPKLIESLQNIYDGQFDNHIQEMLSESGLVKKISSDQSESKSVLDDKESVSSKKNNFTLWVKTLTKKQRIEIKKLVDSGWTENEIRRSFDAKNSQT